MIWCLLLLLLKQFLSDIDGHLGLCVGDTSSSFPVFPGARQDWCRIPGDISTFLNGHGMFLTLLRREVAPALRTQRFPGCC